MLEKQIQNIERRWQAINKNGNCPVMAITKPEHGQDKPATLAF